MYAGRIVEAASVNEFFAGEHNPILVQIPHGVYHGMKGVGEREAIIINTVTEPYNRSKPDEFRFDPHDNEIPYDWALKEG
jgi:dTDP-4-dehydrorhamnose 3,5-epimerase